MNRFEEHKDFLGLERKGVVYEEYNLNDPVGSDRFDTDCQDAYDFFAKEGLKFEVNSHHWCEITDEDRVVDMVSVEWEFWKEEENE